MSDWVVHFTDSKDNLASILHDRFIRPSGPFGNGRNFDEVRERHMSACFSEIPLDHLSRLYERHGPWGIGFNRRVIDAADGGRVWYLERDTEPARALFDLTGHVLRAQDFDHLIWKLSPFIDVMSDAYNYRFDWEREWRVPGGLDFEMTDVAFLLQPDTPGVIRVTSDLEEVLPSFVSNGPAGLSGAPEVLGDDLDHLVAVFGEHFVDPVELLFHDEEDSTGYSWPVAQWDTRDAVNESLPGVSDPVREQLIAELEGMSTIWVNLDEWASVDS